MTGNYPSDLRREVDAALKTYFPSVDRQAGDLGRAMEYALYSPGKRFRPVLALTAASAVGGRYREAMPTACAIEFIHAYSLTHDDLPALDNDTLRRGRPTCHVKFGEDIAILAGDALLTEAFAIIVNEQLETAPTERVIGVLKEISKAAGIKGMVGGQAVDIIETGQEMDLETLRFVHEHKTGALIEAAARCGAILGGGTKQDIEALGGFGKRLGLAFQMVDDILDVAGSVESIGKNVGSDRENNKMTFASGVGVEESRRMAQETIDEAIAGLDGSVSDQDGLIELARFVIGRTS